MGFDQYDLLPRPNHFESFANFFFGGEAPFFKLTLFLNERRKITLQLLHVVIVLISQSTNLKVLAQSRVVAGEPDTGETNEEGRCLRKGGRSKQGRPIGLGLLHIIRRRCAERRAEKIGIRLGAGLDAPVAADPSVVGFASAGEDFQPFFRFRPLWAPAQITRSIWVVPEMHVRCNTDRRLSLICGSRFFHLALPTIP